jgi:ABC-type multidrug transport system ATPase subunit
LTNPISKIQPQFSILNSQFSIKTEGLSKRFNSEWIVKKLTYTFESGNTYALTGPNGSGKSTLLQLLWGQLPQSSGNIKFTLKNSEIPVEEVFRHVAIATPYMDLIDEFTLAEQLAFHFRTRAIRNEMSLEEVISKLHLTDARNKVIANFSSGMKQRLKLGLAFYTQSNAIFLDEPGSNLDDVAFDWYWENLRKLPANQLIIIASNQPAEYPKDSKILNLLNLKQSKTPD